jgi:hypothetical protein
MGELLPDLGHFLTSGYGHAAERAKNGIGGRGFVEPCVPPPYTVACGAPLSRSRVSTPLSKCQPGHALMQHMQMTGPTNLQAQPAPNSTDLAQPLHSELLSEAAPDKQASLFQPMRKVWGLQSELQQLRSTTAPIKQAA